MDTRGDTRGDADWADEWADDDDEAEDFLDAETARLSADPMFKRALEDASHRSACVQMLTELRNRCGMTQGHVAKMMSIGQPTVSEFEGGATDPRLSTLQRYARAIGGRAVVVIEAPDPHHYCTPPTGVSLQTFTMQWREETRPEGHLPISERQDASFVSTKLRRVNA